MLLAIEYVQILALKANVEILVTDSAAQADLVQIAAAARQHGGRATFRFLSYRPQQDLAQLAATGKEFVTIVI